MHVMEGLWPASDLALLLRSGQLLCGPAEYYLTVCKTAEVFRPYDSHSGMYGLFVQYPPIAVVD